MSQPEPDPAALLQELQEARKRLAKLESTRVLLKLAEERLRESEATLRAQFEASPVAIFNWVKKGQHFVLTDLNKAARALIGPKADALLNRPAAELLQDRPDLQSEIEKCHHRKEGHHWETEYRRAGADQPRHLLLTTTFVPPKLVMLHAADISKRKGAEAALRESELHFRTIADFTVDWEYWRAPDDRFLYVSPSCERITGYTPEDFYADPDLVEKIILPEDLEAFQAHRKRQRVPGKQYHLVFHVRHRAGRVVRIGQTSQAVADPARGLLGLRASNRDLAEIETLLREAPL